MAIHERQSDAVIESSLDDARAAVAGVGPQTVLAAAHCVEDALAAALDEITADYLASAEPGPDLMRLLGLLPVRSLSATSRLAWLQAHARCAAWWAAQEPAMLVAFAGHEPQVATFEVRGQQVVLEDVAREELAVAMRWTSSFAQRKIDEARVLTGALPATLEALAAGSISPAHTRVVVESAQRLAVSAPVGSAEFRRACSELELRILPVAVRDGIGRTRSAANRAVTAVDPAGRHDRRSEALRGRGVWLRDEPDGVATLTAKLSAEHAHACYAAVEQLAAAGTIDGLPFCDDRATMGERRSLALVHLTLGTGRDVFSRPQIDGSHAALPEIRTHVDVVVDLPTLLGLQDNDGEIVGGGELPAEAIRTLVLRDASATMRRLVTDPTTGHLLDIGRKRYAVPDALREFIVMRDQRCRFPGCNARAATSEIDHALPWDDGGGTDRGNLGALCKRHHQVKSLGGWQIADSTEDGGCTWVSPNGNTYGHEPVAVNHDAGNHDVVGHDVVALDVALPSSHALIAEPGVPFAHGGVGQAGDLIHNDP